MALQGTLFMQVILYSNDWHTESPSSLTLFVCVRGWSGACVSSHANHSLVYLQSFCVRVDDVEKLQTIYSKSEGVCVINNVYQCNPQIELCIMLPVLITLHQGAVMHTLHV